MTINETRELERIIRQLQDAVKNGTSHYEPDGLELNRKGEQALKDSEKYLKSVLTVAAMCRRPA